MKTEPHVETESPTTADGEDAIRYVRDVICQVVGALAPDPVDRAGPEQLLVGDLGYDSLRLVELSLVLEELFELESAIDDPPPIGTVAELQEYSLRMVAEGLARPPAGKAVDDVLQGV